MDIMLFIENLSYWHWLLLGLVLLMIEVVFPVGFFLWEGIVALLIGVTIYFFGLTWAFQVLLFAMISPAIMILGQRFTIHLNYAGEKYEPGEYPINLRKSQLIGYTFRLENALENGVTHHTVLGTRWKITGPDLPVGALVIVTDLKDNTLIVEEKEPAIVEEKEPAQ